MSHLIIRDRNFQPAQFYNKRNGVTIKWKEFNANGENSTFTRSTLPSHIQNPSAINRRNHSLRTTAIKRKNVDQFNKEVVLLNGRWDTSNEIPHIVAEMHNVNMEELEVIQNTWGKKFVKSPENTDMTSCIAASPRGSDSGIEGDCSDGNLSWLLNYRIHELPPVPDCTTTDQQYSLSNGLENCKDNHVYISETMSKQYFDQQNIQLSRFISEKLPKEETTKVHGNCDSNSGPKKPPFTYTELIEHALNEKGELTVSGIYQWISDHFPFYKQNDDRWKNSVRHNLSINPHFRKGSKAVHGAGHLWTIAQREDRKTWNIKKQRMQQFIQTSLNDYNKNQQRDLELETATASILPENVDDCQRSLSIEHTEQNIEIEYVNVIDVTNGLEDFLCPPVSKEQMVEECGLSGNYLITDLNPNTLGINLTDAEIITNGNLYDDLNFQCYELQNDH